MAGSTSSSTSSTALPGGGSDVDACQPAAPTGLAGPRSTSGAIRLTWSAPYDGGTTISDYTIQRSTNGSEWTTLNDGVRSTTGYTATGLAGGTRSTSGFSPRTRSTPGRGATSPTPWPAQLRLRCVHRQRSPGNRSVTLQWTAPVSNGGAAITDYIIQRSANGTSGSATITDGVARTTSHTVTGLTNGARVFYFRVSPRRIGTRRGEQCHQRHPTHGSDSTAVVPGHARMTKATLTWATPRTTAGQRQVTFSSGRPAQQAAG